MERSSQGLLEHLARAAGCEYLSDLRCRAPSPELLWAAVEATPAEDYPARQWREAVGYLTGRSCARADGAACRQLLLEYFARGGGAEDA